ncbi:MAG: acyl carrier protein [Lachnospiraceae bacterium]|nr:acyl carrier protein [Lachnospiraceae bacterium]
MSNKENYIKAFVEALEVAEDSVEQLEYQSVAAWDSVGHMSLIAAIEDTFDIMMDTDDIIELDSFKKGMEILSENYGIEF